MDWCPEPPIEPPETQKRYVLPNWQGEYDDFLYQRQRDDEYERRTE